SLELLLEIADGSLGKLIDTAAIVGPALIAVVKGDDHAAVGKIQPVDTDQKRKQGVASFADKFGAGLVRKAALIHKIDVAGEGAVVAENRTASLALAFANLGVTRAAKTIDQVGENLLAFGRAFLRHEHVRALRGSARHPQSRTGKNESRKLQ